MVGWLVATALGVLVVYGIYGETKKGGTQFNKAENITYGTFSRFTWGLALAWVIYACNKGYGSKFRIWPPGRLPSLWVLGTRFSTCSLKNWLSILQLQ